MRTHSYNLFQHSAYLFHFSVHKCTQTFLLHKLDWTLYSTFSNISMLSVWVYILWFYFYFCFCYAMLSYQVNECYCFWLQQNFCSTKCSPSSEIPSAFYWNLNSTIKYCTEFGTSSWKFLKRCSWKKNRIRTHIFNCKTSFTGAK